MRTFRRLAAGIAVAMAPLAVVTVVTPAVSSAECQGRTWNPDTRMCDPPPPVPAWYQPAPAYAQSWAPVWAPPPPPAPQWAVDLDLKPVWNQQLQTWTWIYVR